MEVGFVEDGFVEGEDEDEDEDGVEDEGEDEDWDVAGNCEDLRRVGRVGNFVGFGALFLVRVLSLCVSCLLS